MNCSSAATGVYVKKSRGLEVFETRRCADASGTGSAAFSGPEWFVTADALADGTLVIETREELQTAPLAGGAMSPFAPANGLSDAQYLTLTSDRNGLLVTAVTVEPGQIYYYSLLDDADLDGIRDACDLCPDLSSVPLPQGDLDGDGIPDVCDACPATPDSLQLDLDGDGAGDRCDCEPENPGVSRLAEATPLSLNIGGELSWSTVVGADSYGVLRGNLDQLPSYGSCWIDGLTSTSWIDADTPPQGEGFFYLIVAQSDDCLDSGAGQDGSGAERTAPSCP